MTAQECSQLLLSKNNILIITHTNPDGDTLCSAAALCSALRRAGKRANLFRNPAVTTKYMPHVEKYFAPKSFKSKYIVSVDVATEKMFAEGFDGAIDLCIDHHPTNSHYAKKELVCPDKAACGEIVLAVIKEMCGGITQEEADLLYIAVTTDTGCFQYLNTNAATFRAAAELLEYGADIGMVNVKFFRKASRARLKLGNDLLHYGLLPRREDIRRHNHEGNAASGRRGRRGLRRSGGTCRTRRGRIGEYNDP